MSFLTPWAAWLGLAAIPLVAAFLLRRYRRRRTVPSLVIYQRLLGQRALRQRLARPHHLLALLLSVLALAALVAAAMQPRSEAVPPRDVILVVDTSASMGALEPGQEQIRLERARAELARFLSRLNSADRVTLITAGPEASLELGWTHQHEQVLPRLASLRPTGSGAGLPEALRIADALCGESEQSEIVLVSDGAGLALPEVACRLRYARVGEPADNLAITGLSVREADALGSSEIFLAVHNASDAAREVLVSLELDGALVDAETMTVPPGTTVERLFRSALPDGRELVATLHSEAADALAEDDIAYAVLRPSPPVEVMLLTRHATTFMAEALRLHPRVALTVRSPSELPVAGGPFDLLVVDAPYEGELPRAERVVILDAGADLLGLSTEGRVPSPEVIRWSFDHPLFRFVDLDGVRIAEATATRLPPGATSLVDMADGPLVFALEDGGLELIYFTFHPDRSDLPLRAAFVNLIANLVEWAQPAHGEELRSSVGTGQRLDAVMPGLRLVPLRGEALALGGVDTREPIPAPGIYRIEGAQGEERGLLAANLFSATEADLTPASRLGVGATAGWPAVERSEPFPWWALAWVALALLALEWLLPGLVGLEHRLRRRRPGGGRGRVAAGEAKA